MRRRDVLKLGLGAGATAAAAALGQRTLRAPRAAALAAARRMTIAPLDLELAHGINVRTIAVGGSVPGPQIEGRAGLDTLEFHNACDSPVVVHSPVFVEPFVPIGPHASVWVTLRIPADAGGMSLKAYRVHGGVGGATANGALRLGAACEAVAPGIEQLQVLSINRWRPPSIAHAARCDGTGIVRDHASFDGKLLSASEPIRVRHGDRVRFHFSNADTARGVTLALPQHRFLVAALDGHPVSTPRHVDRLYLGPAESVDAVVTMDRPGRWILGTTHRGDRIAGLGRLVEYAGARGTAVDSEYGIADWDYTAFGVAMAGVESKLARLAAPALALEYVEFPPTPGHCALPLAVAAGERRRLAVINRTRQVQSLELLGHEVELVDVAGRRTAGVRKDVVTLPGFTRVEFEFVARNDLVFLAHHPRVSLEKALKT